MNALPLPLLLHRLIRRPRGVALLMVLSCVVILSMLVVTFLTLVKTDQQSSSAFVQSAEARALADIPINLAIGQIRRGTEQLGYQKTWASQPGMIRTYGLENDGTGVRSRALALYKLYSDETMVVRPAGSVTATSGGLTRDQVSTAIQADINQLVDWDQKPGLFVDINEPVPVKLSATGGVSMEFPVADPRALMPPSGMPVEGFNYANGAIPKALRPTSSTDTRTRLPMPVKWLYILQDGSFTTPSSATPQEATFNATGGIVMPAATNPIVGRVAFWTDDDSCKVNVNTASEGTPWYTPVANTATDQLFAQRLPAQNEFSRYPGHPAQTSLSPVFQAFSADLALPDGINESQRATRLKFYHDLNPRVPWGGTFGGTATATVPLDTTKNQRFYSTLDELLLTPDRSRQHASLDSQTLALGRFFLTPHSRSTEQSQFNKIRLGIWPKWKEAAERTSRDNLIELMNSSGLRGGAAGGDMDNGFNRGEGWSLSRNLAFKTTSSFGASQYATGKSSDFNDGLRTQTVVDGVLAQYMGTPVVGSTYVTVPGFGNRSFLEKYGRAKRDQIIFSMIDQLRTGVNSFRPVVGTKRSYLPPQNTTLNPNRLGEYSAVPLYSSASDSTILATSKPRGFGRWPTITEAALVFMATEKDGAGPKSKTMQAFLVLEPFSPTSGPPAFSANWRFRIEGLEKLQVKVGTKLMNLGFTSDPDTVPIPATDPVRVPAPTKDLTYKVTFNPSLMEGGNKTPFPGLLSIFAQTVADYTPRNAKVVKGGVEYTNSFPFISIPIPVQGSDNFDLVSNEPITITILSGFDAIASAQVLQTLKVQIVSVNGLKVPQIRGSDFGTYNTIQRRFNALKTGTTWNPNALIRDGDTVRSMEASHVGPAKGDLRFLASLYEVPTTYFVAANGYTDAANEQCHSLRDGAWTYGDPNQFKQPTNAQPGKLVKNFSHPASIQPAVPSRMNGALKADNRPGDWDNGVGLIEDGPYVNRADSGSAWFGTDGGYFSRGKDTVGADADFEKTFSPHRQVSSAMIFGGIPTGIDPLNPGTAVTTATAATPGVAGTEPWQTLLFCPNPPSRVTAALAEPTAADHKGFMAPRDHLVLDFFWMPNVEPYALSDSFSTEGKINMNWQMIPFNYIERSTGLHAVLKSTRVTAISRGSVTGETGHYKDPSTPHPFEIRYLVNAEETMRGFRNRFENQHDIFRAPSEICEIFLVPKRMPGASYAPDAPQPRPYDEMTLWWNSPNPGTLPSPFEVTGDNLREAPYTDLYPRLTTKSNIYTVHFRVQALKKSRSSAVASWVEGQDNVVSEHRGSATVERYMDPNGFEAASLNQGGSKFVQTWDTFNRLRIIHRKEFVP